MARVLVTGAAGRQGGAVARLLLERGHDVTGYVRSADAPGALALAADGARVVAGDLADAETLAGAAKGADAVFGLTVPFGDGGLDGEVAQGRALVDAAADALLVYSSVRGADRVDATVEHVDSKSVIEGYLRDRPGPTTVLAPVYFMENALNVSFNQLSDGVFATPLSPGTRLDQVTVLDIAAMAAHAVEHPAEMAGRRVELASDTVTGAEAAGVLGGLLGRDLPYRVIPADVIRRWAGEEIAAMFAAFEVNTEFVDRAALRAEYPGIGWHSFADWARTVDWERLLASAGA
ncbi:NmrA family NAD(P)-binding protein [Longispora sp. K20-0274]|uniref:NmrA family NAD(P)-binding protein n=1 Tax=Longispora sp. K20-0274 TaxID=3088255 RepID=UPI00399B3464